MVQNSFPKALRDHGGGLDAAAAEYGGQPVDWIDLSTGINPVPYPILALSDKAWGALPDAAAEQALVSAARDFWQIPDNAAVLAVPGASAAIAALPRVLTGQKVNIPKPTYNEHQAGFEAAGWALSAEAAAQVLVHPNNPDGRLWSAGDFDHTTLTIIDESFCDVTPHQSHVAQSGQPGRVILKSFGKFWGLAGLRLGFVIAQPDLIADLKAHLGPWPVSGPALEIGAAALSDPAWARETRKRLAEDAIRLDALMTSAGVTALGGCDLFRLYDVKDAKVWQVRLAKHHIWSRIFPYSDSWLRLGLPGPKDWDRLEAALT